MTQPNEKNLHIGPDELSTVTRKRRKILDFLNRHEMTHKIIDFENLNILCLFHDGFQGEIPEHKLTEYKARYRAEMKTGINNRCFLIAENAVKAGAATGMIATNSGALGFASWDRHCINIDVLDNKTVLAYDLTASPNIDERQDYFDVLLITDKNLESLLRKVGDLYGGEWFVVNEL